EQVALGHHDLRHDDRRQRRQRRVAQAALHPVGQAQLALGDQEEAAGHDGDHRQPDDRDQGFHVAHPATPLRGLLRISEASTRRPVSPPPSIISPTHTAAAIATTMFSRYGSANAATAAAPAMTAAKLVALS